MSVLGTVGSIRTVKYFDWEPKSGQTSQHWPSQGSIVQVIAAIVFAFALIALAGCADERQAVADLLSPPSAAEIAARVESLASEGKFDEAVSLGEGHLGTSADPTGVLHRVLARLHTELGNTERAVYHLERSHGSTSASASAQPRQPNPAHVPFTDLPAPAQAQTSAAPLASASIDGDAIEARAGGVVARVPR